jgi:hypothetical protein
MRRLSIFLLAGCAGLVPVVAPTLAHADAPKSIGVFDDWSAFATGAPKPTTCYVSGTPAKSEPKAAKRGDIFLQVSFRKAGGGAAAVSNEVSFIAGYPYKEGSDADLAIGGMKVPLFTEGDGAWAKDANTDAQIVAALKQGKSATVKGTSAKGTVTTDSFVLKGFDQALAAAMKACAIKPTP